MGRKLVEHTLPEIAEQLSRIADNLEDKKLNPTQKKLDDLIEFLEYEEAFTVDPKTAIRIRQRLEQLGVWKLKVSQHDHDA